MGFISIDRHLLHTVDIYSSSPNTWSDPTFTLVSSAAKCMVDESVGRARNVAKDGSTDVYDYAVTFGPGIAPWPGTNLYLCKDRLGVQIFERAEVLNLRRYRDPVKGVIANLAQCRDLSLSGPPPIGGPLPPPPTTPISVLQGPTDVPGSGFTRILPVTPLVLWLITDTLNQRQVTSFSAGPTDSVNEYKLSGNVVTFGYDTTGMRVWAFYAA